MSSKFGDFIAEKRKQKEISLRKMAELLDISPAYWSDIEKGRRNPPNINKIEEIAKILGVNKSTVSRVPVDLPRSVYVHKNVLKQFRV